MSVVFVLCCVTSDLCDELITRPESPVGFACPIVRDLAALTLRRLMSRMGAPHIYIYIYGIRRLRVKYRMHSDFTGTSGKSIDNSYCRYVMDRSGRGVVQLLS